VTIVSSIASYNVPMVFPTDLAESLLIGDTGESLPTGVEGGEMPFSSCVGSGGPRDEPMLRRRPLCDYSGVVLAV